VTSNLVRLLCQSEVEDGVRVVGKPGVE
jgi:hypothetical protein